MDKTPKQSPEKIKAQQERVAAKLLARKELNAANGGKSRLEVESSNRWQRPDVAAAERVAEPVSDAGEGPSVMSGVGDPYGKPAPVAKPTPPQFAPGELIDVDFTDIRNNLENAKSSITPDGRVMKTGNQREWKPGEQHPGCKYSDATIRLVRALHREAGTRDTVRMMHGIMPRSTVVACRGQAAYRMLAIPHTKDYERARHVYQNYIKGELLDQQQLLNYQVKNEKEYQRMLKSKGIHKTQLPESQWDATSAFNKAGDGQPSLRTERQHRTHRKPSARTPR